MTIETQFLDYSAKKLDQLCSRIETCVAKLSPDQVWMRGSETQNAAGNLVLHLTGNVRQWILTGIGGAPNARIRDAEFAARDGVAPDDLARRLREAVDAALVIIRALPAARLTERVTIQGHDVSLLEAIYHVVEHFSGHASQIMFITKMLTGEDLGFYAYLSKPQAQRSQTP
jgi:uncharacterized damage-inducible protein DinB